MQNKERYREFCAENGMVPIFSSPWWLDASCGDSWDVCLVEKGGKISASMPYAIRKRRFGLVHIGQPNLSPHLGPWIAPSNANSAKKLGREKDLMEGLINQLPKYSSFSQGWHYSIKNWLPFYWGGYQQTTYYTYVLEDLTDLDAVFDSFLVNIRGDIRKASSRYNIKVYDDCPLGEFLDLNEKTFARQGKALPYTREYVGRIIEEAKQRGQSRWFVAKDEDGRAHAGVLIVWDELSAYYLIGGGDPALRKSGATSLCVWEAIKFASTVSKAFDFEGSMIEPIERFFRGFGAKQKTYFLVSKTPSRLLKIGRAIKSIL